MSLNVTDIIFFPQLLQFFKMQSGMAKAVVNFLFLRQDFEILTHAEQAAFKMLVGFDQLYHNGEYSGQNLCPSRENSANLISALFQPHFETIYMF